MGSKIFTGPWGGGNNFIKNLSKYLKNNGYQVFFDLNQEDLDFILLTDQGYKVKAHVLITLIFLTILKSQQ